MAMSYHMEARIKQDRLNRWHEQKVRADAGPSNQGLNDRLDEMIYKEKMDRVVTTDPGQFNQIRSSQSAGARVQYDTGVIFQKVTHDPNFNYRLERAMGGNALHVNPIYKVMYPGAYTYRCASTTRDGLKN